MDEGIWCTKFTMSRIQKISCQNQQNIENNVCEKKNKYTVPFVY